MTFKDVFVRQNNESVKWRSRKMVWLPFFGDPFLETFFLENFFPETFFCVPSIKSTKILKLVYTRYKWEASVN